ncbi:hypothetical protein V2J09_017771 [Rumex salicifolius]
MEASSKGSDRAQRVNFDEPRWFMETLRSDLKETFLSDDPFRQMGREASQMGRARKALEYFVPAFEWLPSYNLKLFRYDLLAGVTIASLAIPQGISYANLARIPPIIGLYSSFVPAFVYAMFGSSRNLAVGTVAACSLLLSETIGEVVDVTQNPTLYLKLIFTATLVTGVFQLVMGLLRLGIVVDFLSHSTITGFMGGTAIIIILQQLKGMFGLRHFTTKTDVVSVTKAIIHYRKERNRKPKLFWISAMAPLLTVAIGGLFAYFGHVEKYGIPIVGPLKKGINPISINDFVFGRKYIAAPIKAGIITAILAMAEGIAIGRSFGMLKNQQVDGNKEMIAYGLMNIVGSCTSCYLTTGPFSKTAVNVNAGCKTQMANAVMGLCVMLTLLFLAPLFSYTPLVALSAIITSAMLGLIDYPKILHLYKVDKYDFLICMTSLLGVTFISMDYGLALSVMLSILRALLYTARPANIKLGNIQNSDLYRDIKQYPTTATGIPGIVILQLGAPIYFSNSTYLRERVLRWIRDEEDGNGVTTIDMTGIETFFELKRIFDDKEIKMCLVNPRREVLEKMMASELIDTIGKDAVFLSIVDAVHFCQFSMTTGDIKKLADESNHDNIV